MTTPPVTPIRRWLVCLALAVLACSPGKGKTAYVGATLWNGTGAPPTLDAVIIVSRDRIDAVGPPDAVKVPRGAEVIHLDGKFVIPGLIDGHTHATRWSLARYLAYGVTSVRNMGGVEDSVVALRNAVSLGSALGPRMFISGAIIDAEPGPGIRRIRNAQEARRAIDSLVLLNVSQAKIFAHITPRLLEPLMDEARTLHLPVAAHLGKVDALTAAGLGVRSLEHSSGVVQASVPNAPALLRAYDDTRTGLRLEARLWGALDSARVDRTARALAQANVAVVPTLVLFDGLAHIFDAGYLNQIDRTGMPDDRSLQPAVMANGFGVGRADAQALLLARRNQDLFVRRFARFGGLVVAGTDSPDAVLPPGSSLARELALLVAAGFSPERALLAATRDAAQLLGADSLGTLEAGKLADFVVLTANPVENIANVATVDIVVAGGVRHAASALRREGHR